MTVYSPSQTKAWDMCPVYRQLAYKMHLVPRRVAKRDIAAIGGRAFALAMEVYNKNSGLENAHSVAQYQIAQAKKRIVELGREVPDWELAYYSSLEPRLEHALNKYHANNPIKDYEIIAVEHKLANHGNARIDLAIRDGFGPMVVDYKFKLRLESKWYDREVEKYRNAWQLIHYTWGYGEEIKEELSRYGICLVVGEPKFSAVLHEYPVHPETMLAWKASSERMWRHMENEDRGVEQPFMATTHETQFGPCEFAKACFEHRWDTNLMLANDYVIDDEVSL